MIGNLRWAQILEHEGEFTRKQAETLAKVYAEAITHDVASKADLQKVITKVDGLKLVINSEVSELRHELNQVEQRLESKIDKLALQLTVMVGSMITAAVVILGVLIKF